MSPSLFTLPYILPFFLLVFSAALFPLVLPHFWHHHGEKIMIFWIPVLLIPIFFLHGTSSLLHVLKNGVLENYIPFISMIFALYVAGNGILIKGGPWGRPLGNTFLLAIGALLASIIGTTGAAMLLIQPLLRANAGRKHRLHLVVVLIILVANIGGSLSPLGDPPLLVGFLSGVPFFWPLLHIYPIFLILSLTILSGFFLIDYWLDRQDKERPVRRVQKFRIRGYRNVFILLGIVMLAGSYTLLPLWVPDRNPDKILVVKLLISSGLFFLGYLSLRVTPRGIHAGNRFSLRPIIELAILFLAIFITVEPVIELLAAGAHGPFAFLFNYLADKAGNPNPLAYFWMIGLSSAFLDNAPSYLVFFNLAGGNALLLMKEQPLLLEAISMASVFFGGITYLGNAPNMMLKLVASRQGIRMPDFFTYMFLASVILFPLLGILSFVYLH